MNLDLYYNGTMLSSPQWIKADVLIVKKYKQDPYINDVNEKNTVLQSATGW